MTRTFTHFSILLLTSTVLLTLGCGDTARTGAPPPSKAEDDDHDHAAKGGHSHDVGPNGGPLGKTERCLFVVLATAFPGIMPFLLGQLVNGSLITTGLRLRAAYRELKAQRASEPLADVVSMTTPITVPLQLTGAVA